MLLRRLYPASAESSRNHIKFNVRATIGASGAVTATFGKGVTVAKSATGRYTATIAGASGSVGKIIQARCSVLSATHQVSWCRTAVDATGVCTFSIATAAAPTVEAEPASSDELMISIIVRASSGENS